MDQVAHLKESRRNRPPKKRVQRQDAKAPQGRPARSAGGCARQVADRQHRVALRQAGGAGRQNNRRGEQHLRTRCTRCQKQRDVAASRCSRCRRSDPRGADWDEDVCEYRRACATRIAPLGAGGPARGSRVGPPSQKSQPAPRAPPPKRVKMLGTTPTKFHQL
jgi:hypothetical protein